MSFQSSFEKYIISVLGDYISLETRGPTVLLSSNLFFSLGNVIVAALSLLAEII